MPTSRALGCHESHTHTRFTWKYFCPARIRYGKVFSFWVDDSGRPSRDTLEHSPHMWWGYGFLLQETIDSTYLDIHVTSNLWTCNMWHLQIIQNMPKFMWLISSHHYIIIHHDQIFAYACLFQESKSPVCLPSIQSEAWTLRERTSTTTSLWNLSF